MLLAIYMTSRPVSWIRIFIRVNKIWELPTFRFLTWVIKWEKSPKHYWLFLHSSKDTANPFWHQVMASWYSCCSTHALAPKKNCKQLYQGRSFFPLRILKHLNLNFYFNLTNLNFIDVSHAMYAIKGNLPDSRQSIICRLVKKLRVVHGYA